MLYRKCRKIYIPNTNVSFASTVASENCDRKLYVYVYAYAQAAEFAFSLLLKQNDE